MAIQVAGQPVITDARALNNITSIDSTTATAIGNAVGGGWSQITTANISAVSEVWIPLSTSYEEHLVVVEDIDVTATNWTMIGFRYGTTSQSISSTAHRGIRNQPTESNFNSSLLSTSTSIRLGANHTNSFWTYLHIQDAASTTKLTRTHISDIIRTSSYSTAGAYDIWTISSGLGESNQYIRMKPEIYSSGWNFKAQGKYTVYGK